jgi:hypothetical protein
MNPSKSLLSAACAVLLPASFVLATLSACVFGAGCSSFATVSSDDGDAAVAEDVRVPKRLDAGPPEVDAAPQGFPAAHPAAPEILSLGGPVLVAPRIVPIVFSSDTQIANITKLTKAFEGSAYWTATTSEYGVGAATTSEPIVVTDAPPVKLSSLDIAPWLKTHLEDAGSGWGTPDANAIYAIYYPEGTRIEDEGFVSCADYGAYHDEGEAGGVKFAFAVMPRCSGGGGFSDLDMLSVSTAHELIEAATDPLAQTNPAFRQPDKAHLVWSVMPLGEVGDMCTYDPDAYFRPADIGFTVQRTWSNAAAKAHHDPCVPSAGAPYFNSVPVLDEDVSIDLYTGATTTKGVAVPVGKSKTIDVKLFADADTGGTWDVVAYDVAQYSGGPAELKFSFDKRLGENGDTLRLTITRLSAGSIGGSEFMVVSSLGRDQQKIWFGFAGN